MCLPQKVYAQGLVLSITERLGIKNIEELFHLFGVQTVFNISGVVNNMQLFSKFSIC